MMNIQSLLQPHNYNTIKELAAYKGAVDKFIGISRTCVRLYLHRYFCVPGMVHQLDGESGLCALEYSNH